MPLAARDARLRVGREKLLWQSMNNLLHLNNQIALMWGPVRLPSRRSPKRLTSRRTQKQSVWLGVRHSLLVAIPEGPSAERVGVERPMPQGTAVS